MAELPRYQQTGRVFADLPQFDFANVREAFKSSQSLTSALDRVTDFANKSAAKTAERKAEQFSVDNPLTLEQVQEAAKSGITPEDLVAASGGGQIWQDTVRKLQGEQLRTQLEVLGKQALLDLQTQVDTNQITNMNDVRAKQESIVNGLRKTLNFSPDSVMRFDATMGTVASSLYKEAQNKLVKDYKLSQQSQGIANLNNSVKAFQALIKHQDVTDPTMIRDIEFALADQLERQSAEGGADFALSQRTEFVKKMEEAKISLLTQIGLSTDFAKDEYEAMLKIRNNDFGNKTVIYDSFNEDDKAKVRNAVSSAWTKLEQSKALKQKEEKDLADKTFRNNVIAKTSRGKSGKLNDYDNAFLNGALSFSEWKTANNPEGSMGDPLLISQIETKISRGIITNITQLPAGLSPKAIAKFNDLISNQDSKDALKTIYIGANVPLDAFSFDTNQTSRKTKIEGIFRDIRNQTDKNGNLLYPNQMQAAIKAVEMYKGDSDTVSNETIQKSKLKAATKLISKDDFNYDIVIPKEKLKEIASNKISFMNRSERDTWVNNVLAYQKAREKTGLSASSIDTGN